LLYPLDIPDKEKEHFFEGSFRCKFFKDLVLPFYKFLCQFAFGDIQDDSLIVGDFSFFIPFDKRPVVDIPYLS